jgi:Protein of unknown function (DUF1569)
MELSIESNMNALRAFELPAIREASNQTFFNPTNFFAIYNRMAILKSSAKRRWGKMNVVQMVNHLKVATGSAINMYNLKDESTFTWRVIFKFLALRFLKRFPKNTRAAEGFKIEMNNELDFEYEKEQVLGVLKKAYVSTSDYYQHPLFGKMSREEWGRLVFRHFDHHLRQFNS